MHILQHHAVYKVKHVLHQRIFLSTAEAKVVITATESVIGDKVLELRKNVDEALTLLGANIVKHIVVSTGDNDDSSVDLHNHHTAELEGPNAKAGEERVLVGKAPPTH